MRFLWILLLNVLHASINDPFLDYQKYLSRMGEFSENPSRPLLLETSRSQEKGISGEDYKFLKGTSAFAASGAEWAHKVGAFGRNVSILVLENSGINHADMQKVVTTSSSKIPILDFKGPVDHGSAMASLIYAIAPKATIHVMPIDEIDISFMNVQIINASFGGSQVRGFQENFKNITANDGVLIVQSAGNDHENLSTGPYTQNCGRLLPFAIFTGNLRQDYKTSTWSGFPGKNSKFQQNFLWVVSDHILTATGPDGSTQYSPTSGTSNAAAIVSGAAALFSSLTAAQIKEVLLESSDRDIFQEFGSGYRAIHVPDPTLTYYRQQAQVEKGVDSLNALQREHVPITTYDASLWGKGILNIHNALLYAELKTAHPDKKAAWLRESMLKLINRKQQAKATIIQRAFRKHQISKKHQPLTLEMFYPRKGITLNISIKDRIFNRVAVPKRCAQASNFIKELTDAERLEKLGIMLPDAPRELRKIHTPFPYQITDNKWEECQVPRHVSAKFTTFMQSPLAQVEKAFDAFFTDELFPILKVGLTDYSYPAGTSKRVTGPAYAADLIFEKYKQLLVPFYANRIVTLGKNWLELETHNINKIVHAKATIISLIHDGTRNRDRIEKSKLVEFAICLYERIKKEGLLTDQIKSAILALLKDNKEEGNQTILPFMKKNNLLFYSFNALVVKDNHETDMLELYMHELRGLDLLSEEKRQTLA